MNDDDDSAVRRVRQLLQAARHEREAYHAQRLNIVRSVSERAYRISQQTAYLAHIVEINDRHDALDGLYSMGHFVRDHAPVDPRLSPSLIEAQPLIPADARE